MTPTLASPTTEKIINDFIAVFPNVKHVIYDTISSDAALNAFEKHYGTRGLAAYDFSKAKTVVGIDADFLGDWQGGGYAKGYAQAKAPSKHHGEAHMSWHMQFESNMSLTGANADHRIPLYTRRSKKDTSLSVRYFKRIECCYKFT
jgi:molybdopterin-containing oxidoreductase family iron-sulfur binding subunit